ncbi:nucleotidyltransferase family protein [Nitrosococcus wardiae]|uniref:Nucleotidyltransferase family protein n=1 Tax=Nitrosococcus wardiae TaxID=1814290 RepID=A0A4P7C158_9GAMM|nr:nucleotidyltransferase family protein [Nitrosococcus wardiae]QBQ54516.1 hypothetical protein E3U44_08350 [Nitrosococcus wardiae]
MLVKQPLSGAEQLLLKALCQPESLFALQVGEWDLLLRVARQARLLASLGEQIEQRALLDQLPFKVAEHMTAARALANQRQRQVLWEINRLQRALTDIHIPCVLLKGGAYLLAKLPVARGRLLADVDLLVPKTNLKTVELTLKRGGWEAAKVDDYDQQYYRRWMHELPPMRHRDRQVEVDIHHTILPVTSRLHPNPDLLLDAAQSIEGTPFKVLAPVDMVLHSATHLFYDSELDGQLRDLVDLDGLLRHFGREFSFWESLVPRAIQLELQRPLFYALRYTRHLLETPVPADVIREIENEKPSVLVSLVMDKLVPRALFPEHPDHPRWSTGVACWLLYVRSHYLRMPMHLLMPHLARKAIGRAQNKYLHHLKTN